MTNTFNGLGTHLGNLSLLSRAKSRSISPENRTGEKGGGAKATDGTGAIAVTINGEPREVPAGLTIAGLIDHLGLGGKRVAVERNKAIAPRATHAVVVLEDGDRLELVTFVGGG